MPISLTLTMVHRSAHFQSQRLKKNGRNATGSQRARYQECLRTLVLEHKVPRYAAREKERILAAATLERMSQRAIGRTFSPCHQTVVRWSQ